MNKKHGQDEAPRGSLVLALIFFGIFVVMYFANFKYLAGLWHVD